jgi:hypothetical protein
MDTKGLKKLIKEAVRETIQEELKDILLEAIRSPKLTLEGTPVGINGIGVVNETKIPSSTNDFSQNTRSFYSQMMSDFKPGTETISMNTSSPTPQGTYIPSGVGAGIEGTLHPGELGLDQIMGLINTK